MLERFKEYRLPWLLYSDLISNKWNSFPQVQSVLPMMVVSEWSLLALIFTHEPFVTFSLPYLAEEGRNRVALVHTCCSGMINPLQMPKPFWQQDNAVTECCEKPLKLGCTRGKVREAGIHWQRLVYVWRTLSKSPEPWNTSSFLWGVYKRLLVCFCLKSWFVWTNMYKEGSNCCISQRQLCFMALFAGILPRTPLTTDRRWKNIWNWDGRKTLRCISGNAGWTKLESVCPWEPPTLSHTMMSDEGSAHDLANSLLIWVLPGEPVYLRKPVLL